jgi:hypothetical protein
MTGFPLLIPAILSPVFPLCALDQMYLEFLALDLLRTPCRRGYTSPRGDTSEGWYILDF